MTETITIPGYSIARKLGQGGMATVYLATQHSFERDVALKVMSPLLNSDPSFAARFKREARIVAQLSHASIVPVFDVGEHQSHHYLSMEYLSGGDLKHRLLQGEHDLSLALNVCIALSAALDAAHRKGFVHRDIKPENILFREDGTPVLTDFGIARAVDSGRSMTLAGMLVGTPDYMSPEQVKGLELDGRSDLYSLGIVFFEIVTGAAPFKADSNLSVALKQLSEPLPALPAEYAAYQEFLDCLTAKDREQRFASGAEVVRALRVIGPERTVRNRAMARSATVPGVAQTRPSMVQAGALASTPAPDPRGYASQPTLAWPRTNGSPDGTSPPQSASSVAAATSPTQTTSPPQTQTQTTNPPALTNTPQPVGTTPHSAEPPRADGVSVGKRSGAPDWIKSFAQRSQPFWMGAAALSALVVGLTLIVGSFRKGAPPSHPPSAASSAAPSAAVSTRSTPVVVAAATPVTAPAVAGQTPQAPPTTAALANAAPVSTSTSVLPASASATPTPTHDAAQAADAVAPEKAAVDASQAKAEAAARHKRLLEERRERKAEEAQKLAQEAAEVKAAQMKEQESHIVALLAAAKSEYAAGALWQPAGANAADHYRDILKLQPDRAEALAGARRVADVLAAEAAQNESIGDVYNTGLLIAQVQTLQPGHPKLAELQAKLQQMQNTPASPDALARSRLDRAAKLIARAEEDLGHTPLDYHAVDDATDQYDRAVSIASTAPGLPSLRERLVSAYAVAVTTEINNHDTRRAHKLINTAHKRKWSSDELDQLEASLQAAEAPATATIKEAGSERWLRPLTVSMYLTLEVVSPQAASLGARRRQIVGTKGLTIGRSPGNDWVIPDPYVSKQHARIVCSEGRFFVEGLGRNPIALGRADNAIPTSQPQALENGDRLFIDQYEILVAALPGDPPGEALVPGGFEAEPDAGPVDSISATPTPAVASLEAARIPDVWDKGIVEVSSETAELDPLHALGDRGSVAAEAAPRVNWQQSSPLDAHFKPPAPVQGGIPDNWARSILVPRPAALRQEAASPPPAVPSASPVQQTSAVPAPAPAAEVRPQSAGVDLVALLRAAGLPDRDLSPEVAQELGKVLRVVVHGVMDVLQGRAEIKAQFRLPHTRVQARENNPLKLSPNVESALHTLLVQRNPGYLPTVQAFEDAFADIRHHQLAMLEGLREAFGSMLGAFDPQTLERDFEQTVKRAGLLGGLSGKSRYWELYTERFGRLGRDADDTFRRLFGDVFADAYERQLERLRKEQK